MINKIYRIIVGALQKWESCGENSYEEWGTGELEEGKVDQKGQSLLI